MIKKTNPTYFLFAISVFILVNSIIKINVSEASEKRKPNTNERVYFAVNKNPFAGYYSNKGFKPLKNDIKKLMKPWQNILKTKKTFNSFPTDDGVGKIEIKKAEVPPEGYLGVNAFTTSSYSMFWSSDKIKLKKLSHHSVKLNETDNKILQHEVIARSLEWREFKQKSSELNPNPPKILDPSNENNIDISIYTPIENSDFIITHVKLYSEYFSNQTNENVKRLMYSGMLILYDLKAKRIVGSLSIESSPQFFMIEGDNKVYLLVARGCYECDGTTILSIGTKNGDSVRNKDIVYIDKKNAINVWLN